MGIEGEQKDEMRMWGPTLQHTPSVYQDTPLTSTKGDCSLDIPGAIRYNSDMKLTGKNYRWNDKTYFVLQVVKLEGRYSSAILLDDTGKVTTWPLLLSQVKELEAIPEQTYVLRVEQVI